MANEISNISHAAISIRVGPDPFAPLLLSSWGIRDDTLQRAAALGDGIYTAELVTPLSGLAGDTPAIVETDYLLQYAGPAFPDQWGVLLLPPIGVFPVAGQRVQLSLLVMTIVTPAGGEVDGTGTLSVELRRVPTQD